MEEQQHDVGASSAARAARASTAIRAARAGARQPPHQCRASTRIRRPHRRHGACANGSEVVAVSDNGIGMSPELLRRVRSVRAGRARARPRRRAASASGSPSSRRSSRCTAARSSARSAGLGQGTEFIVTLPAGDRRPNRRWARSESQRAAIRCRACWWSTTTSTRRRPSRTCSRTSGHECRWRTTATPRWPWRRRHARTRAARHRPAGDERLRSRSALARGAAHARSQGGGRHRLRAGDGPAACAGGGVRRHLVKPVATDALQALFAA